MWYSGVGEGGAGGATAPPLLKVGGGGGHCPPTLGHPKIKRRKDFFMQYVSHSSYLVSIEAIAIGSSISMKQLLSKFFVSDCN